MHLTIIERKSTITMSNFAWDLISICYKKKKKKKLMEIQPMHLKLL